MSPPVRRLTFTMDATTQRDALEAARELARANKHMQARALLRRQFEAVARDDHTQTKPVRLSRIAYTATAEDGRAGRRTNEEVCERKVQKHTR